MTVPSMDLQRSKALSSVPPSPLPLSYLVVGESRPCLPKAPAPQIGKKGDDENRTELYFPAPSSLHFSQHG